MIESMDNTNINSNAIEKWQSLNEEQRNKIVNKIHEVMNFSNTNFYKDYVALENNLKNELGENGYTGLISNENPCLVLTLCDPVLSRIIQRWLYSTIIVFDDDGSIIWNDRMPFAGFFLDEIYFDKSSLMKYSDEEKEIINKAIDIIKNKGL